MIFTDNKYTKIYFSIISKAIAANRRKHEGTYLENHHIIPASLGGSNSKHNMVLLTGREHFICHMLLPKMVETKKHIESMYHALGHMLWSKNNLQQRYKVNSNLYDALKRKISINRRQRVISESTREKISRSKIGSVPWNKGIPHSDDTRKKISLSIELRGGHKGENNSRYGVKLSNETKSKISASNTGKKRSDELKKQMSDYAIERGIRPPSLRNTIWIFNSYEGSSRRWDPSVPIPAGWSKGRLPR